MIAVTGATGNAGSQVVRALLERDQEVRVLARDAGRARSLFGSDVELAVCDLADGRAVRSALAGAEAVFLSCADDPRRVAWEMDVIDAASALGVGRIVKLSSHVAELGSPVAFWDWHAQVERHLRASGVPAIVLRSAFFMTNVLIAAPQDGGDGKVYAPAGSARIAMIDPRDVGAAAAAVLAETALEGRTYTLTGPEAITYAQATAALSAATGRSLEFAHVPDADALAGMLGAGFPEAVAHEVVKIFALARAGGAEQVTRDVESLTGRPARGFTAFARDHAARLGRCETAGAR